MSSKQEVIDSINASLVVAQALVDGDLAAQLAAALAQLAAAQDALQAEIVIEQADAAMVSSLQGKIAAALAALA